MSWLIVGTVPDEDFPLVRGRIRIDRDFLEIGQHQIKIARGTPALAATACMAASVLGIEPPEALLVGDTGKGSGSRKLYAHLVEAMPDLELAGITFHYLLPDVYWHNQVLWAAQKKSRQPLLVADAGFMYVAKMSGFAADYDLFTPDIGEMCFLADETAPHPFYTRGFLLEDESRVEEYISRAYSEKNAARHLMVKGAKDYIVQDQVILSTVSEPSIEAMEAIGGTGDSLTGIITANLMAGYEIPAACHKAALSNRYLGLLARPSPAFSVADLLPFLEQSIKLGNPR
ncbi:NAD(P)H-hydrate dehydratase [Desulfonatronovibrio hydrogenovorans]|uniref:NAD(P)H-hydrate dehydratase n=1 Tax=Desulfonatronovibrio hydrogenovorans TaxID=53245 RepID=UPI00048B07EA|nr:NAD(P)H-hydrate dehydratase [Desulfonatronovibrio hydrogenovorans]